MITQRQIDEAFLKAANGDQTLVDKCIEETRDARSGYINFPAAMTAIEERARSASAQQGALKLVISN